MRYNNIDNENGFTIIEALLAVVVIAMIVIGSSFFMYANQRNISSAKIQRLAMWNAINRIELLKSSSIAYGQGAELSPGTSISLGNTTGHRITTIVESTNYETAVVQVTWGTPIRSVTLATLIAQPQ